MERLATKSIRVGLRSTCGLYSVRDIKSRIAHESFLWHFNWNVT